MPFVAWIQFLAYYKVPCKESNSEVQSQSNPRSLLCVAQKQEDKKEKYFSLNITEFSFKNLLLIKIKSYNWRKINIHNSSCELAIVYITIIDTKENKSEN